jgi:hypothetical protein
MVEKVIDFSPFIGDDPLTVQLADEQYFKKVKLYEDGRGIYWPSEYDFCPDFLRRYQSVEDNPVISVSGLSSQR